ncbi:MAG TPA: tetratricopeptide repeat protein [Caulobacterales bacterium]|nr:tetratricopeptide repeat protein [Caulobacterales bacterium]
MSRHCVPGRHSTHVLAFTALLGVLACAGVAAADDRDTVARTTLGGDRAVQGCSQAAAHGDVTDVGINLCDMALRRRLSDADRGAALINRGVLHLGRHEIQASVSDFEAAIVINPRNAEAHLNRGAALVQLGQPGPAVAALTTALSLGVRQPHKAYYNRGAAREALGDLRGAYEDYTTALEIEPDWGPAEAEVARFVRTRQERLAGVLANDPNAQR